MCGRGASPGEDGNKKGGRLRRLFHLGSIGLRRVVVLAGAELLDSVGDDVVSADLRTLGLVLTGAEFTVPFAFAIASLITKQKGETWIYATRGLDAGDVSFPEHRCALTISISAKTFASCSLLDICMLPPPSRLSTLSISLFPTMAGSRETCGECVVLFCGLREDPS